MALLPSNVVATAVPLLREEWSASATDLGLVFAAYQAGYVAAVLILLPLTDRLAPMIVIACCSILSALSFIAFPFLAHDPLSAAAIRIVSGIGLAGVYMPGARVVSAAAPSERRGLAVGVYVASFYFGSALSLWAAGALLPSGGWRQAALVLGIVSAIGLPLAVWGTRGVPSPEGRRATLDLRVLREGPVLRTILAYTGHSWELYVSRGWLAAFLASVVASRGVESTAEAAAQGGQWAALMAGLGTIGVILGGRLSDYFGRARTALVVALASAAISIGFGFLAGLPWEALVIIGCLYGFLMAADSGIYTTAVTELAPEGRIGSAQAAQAFLGFLATALAPIAAGLALDLGGGYGAVFALGGLFGLLGALALVPLATARPTRPRSA